MRAIFVFLEIHSMKKWYIFICIALVLSILTVTFLLLRNRESVLPDNSKPVNVPIENTNDPDNKAPVENSSQNTPFIPDDETENSVGFKAVENSNTAKTDENNPLEANTEPSNTGSSSSIQDNDTSDNHTEVNTTPELSNPAEINNEDNSSELDNNGTQTVSDPYELPDD